ncbi:signal recognition particle-like (SRP) GTPase [[Clostridium] ultunense Esp]|uniref:signal recognition particle protein n=1 Tax=Thermicanus aegyptius TaxID=94009 RepID=UPI0002B6F44D|nr:signal recognition particle protein [Thermicanus aegyptius]CCQ92348.1 signal recognition particle-like (SRP) GTPase [[Clostridium] ultunense Esp]
MPFESLTNRLQEAFRRLRGKGKVTEADVNEAMREVRLALLEADVNFKVVKDLIARVKERAVGIEVLKTLNPAQQVIKVVNEELTALMGGEAARLELGKKPPAVIMMVGLQGAGKTTTTGKLALHLKKQQGKRSLLVACDVYRPAAIKQLQVLGESIGLPVFSMGTEVSPVEIARQGLEKAREEHLDVVIIDTAGRLHVDERLMVELKEIKAQVHPQEILLVVDAMTGQDAVTVAESFHQQLDLTGVVLTKLDGDTRGGAALSVKAVTGCPIKFAAMGEKLEALEPFYPDRMASRILGMGDVLTLIEKAQAEVDAEKAKELERKLRKAEFTLEDFLEQMEQVRKLGPLEDLLAMIPGMNRLKDLKIDEKQIAHVEAIIKSMTRQEKQNPQIINYSRRKRIAQGSGTSLTEVNRLLKQFEETKKMMKQLTKMQGKKGKKGKMRFPFMQ